MSEREDIINKIFKDFQMFKNKIKVVFETIDKKCTVKREISLLQQVRAAATYAVNF